MKTSRRIFRNNETFNFMANLYNANNRGTDGVNSVSIAGDHFQMVGADQNTYPSTTIDPVGISTQTSKVTPSAGVIAFESGMTKCEEIDTSHLFQTGNYVTHAGNQIALSCGAGGITLDTTGNIHLNSGGGMTSICSTQTLDISGGTMQMSMAEGIRMSGGTMQMDMESTNVSGNMDFGKNMKMSGSLMVQGELYSTHMTAQKQIMLTEEGGEANGFLNPLQSFGVITGSSSFASKQGIVGKEMVPPPIPGPGMVDVVIDFGLLNTNPALVSAIASAGPAAPALELLATLLSGPTKIKLGFPTGIHLISNQAQNQDFGSSAAVSAAESVAPGNFSDDTMSDVCGPSHSHEYYIPACNLVDGTDAVWDAGQACNQNSAAPAEAMQAFGKSPGKFAKDIVVTAAKKKAESSQIVKKVKKKFGF